MTKSVLSLSLRAWMIASVSVVALGAAMPADAADYTITGPVGMIMLSNNDTATISSGGNITTGFGDPDIYITGNNTTTTINSGTVTAASSVEAIQIFGNNATIINNGSGTISAPDMSAIMSMGNDTHITNNDNGTIYTTGNAGITIWGNDAILTNNDHGSIYSDGNGIEIIVSAANAVINNNDDGVIYSVNADGVNIGGGSTNAILNNSINARIYSINEDGLNIDGDGSTINNNGTIEGDRNGILINGDNTTINNNGTVKGGANDIIVHGTNNKVILGSRTIGSGTGNAILLDFNGATNGILEYTTGGNFPSEGGGYGTLGANPNYTITGGTLGVDYTINQISLGGTVPHNAVVVNNGGQDYAVTPDQFSGADQVVINQGMVQANTIVTGRQQNRVTGYSDTATASADDLNNTPTAAGGRRNKLVWAEGFGSYRERPRDGDTAFSRTRAGGALAGLDNPENAYGYRSGFYVGGFGGQNALGQNTFRTINTSGALAGAYIGKTTGSTYIMGQLAGGTAHNESKRSVATDFARADYETYFINPSLTVMHPLKGDTITWVPSATARYVAQYSESYDETGSTANQNVDSRVNQTVGGRLQIQAQPSTVVAMKSGTLRPSLRLGIDGQKAVGNESIDLTVLGNSVSMDPAGGNDTIDGIVGFNIMYDLDQGPQLYIDGEAQAGLNKGGPSDNIGATTRIGMRWEF